MKQPIYQIIQRTDQAGKLNESYRLPGQEELIPGSREAGKIVFHTDEPYASVEDVRQLAGSIRLFADGEYSKGKDTIEDLLSRKPFISMIDACERYLHRFNQVLNHDTLLNSMLRLLDDTTEPEGIKYALFILSLAPGYHADRKLTNQVYCLGLYEEYTVYAVLFLQLWNKKAIFPLIQNVHGWGRITGILYMPVVNKEQQDWVLLEGTKNNIDESLSVLACYDLAKVSRLLHGKVTDQEFAGIAHLYALMTNPDSALKPEIVLNCQEDMHLFLQQAEARDLDIEAYTDIADLFLFAHSYQMEQVEEDASSLIFTEKCANVVQNALLRGEGIMLAEIIGIPWQEVTYRYLETDFFAHSDVLRYLVSDDSICDKALILAEQNVDLSDIDSKPDYSIATINVLYGLLDQADKGKEFVAAAMRSTSLDMHYEALYVLQRWCWLTDQTMEEIAPELAEMVRKNQDEDPDIIELRSLLMAGKKEDL